MKENSIKKEQSSIEEDIILLKDFTEGNFKRDKLENYKGSYKMGYFYYKDIQQAIEHILSDYKSLQKENEELKEIYRSEKKMKNEYIKLYQDLLLKENVIPVQKIKDKIEDLKMSGGSDGKDNTENTARELAIEALQDILEESEE